jgi:hypothetical protein
LAAFAERRTYISGYGFCARNTLGSGGCDRRSAALTLLSGSSGSSGSSCYSDMALQTVEAWARSFPAARKQGSAANNCAAIA